MAYDPRRARAYNEAIAAGLSPEEAERAAGITDENAFAYVIGIDGTLQENVIGPPKRPNEVIVPRGQDPEIDDEDEDIFANARVTSQSTTTTQTTQITGGGSTIRRVVPTEYADNANSRDLQQQATDLEEQKQARATAIKAAGGSGADVLRDPEFRRLSNQQTAKEYEAEQARTRVPNTGGIVTTVTPGANQTTTTQTVDGNFVTNRGSGFDPQAQTVDANRSGVVPARNFTATDVTDPGEVPGVTVSDRLQTDPGEVPGETVFGPGFATDTGGVASQELIVRSRSAQPQPDPFEVDGAGIGLTDEEIFAQDNPITPEATEDTFAGNGYGFVYDEDGELIPADSAEADRIRSTPENTAVDFAGDGYGFDYDEDGNLIPSDSAEAARIRSEAVPQLDPYEIDGLGVGELTDEEIFGQDNPTLSPEPPLDLSYQDNGDGTGFTVFDANGKPITVVNTEQEAILYIQNAEAAGLGIANEEAARINAEAADTQLQGSAAADTAAKLENAKQQFEIQQRYNQTTQGDWRVILRLAPGASYLYKDSTNTLLQPLRDSDGVVFPYTPTITTNYVARYEPYELVHANYRGFFYKNSHVGEIQINGVFTAQDTAEASYLLAAIHFFRSCTKMFYGQDPSFKGSPPPIVELSGYGQFQFNNHPCLVSNFNYTLPNGVDYIRVTPNNRSLNLANRRNPISSSSVTIDSVVNRLQNAGLPAGAEPRRQDLGSVAGVVSGTQQDTFVPTKMEIQLTLLPIQTREQVSKGFRLDEFARGNLLRGGFW